MTCGMDSSFNSEEWDSFLQESSNATVYHTLEWRSILREAFGYEAPYKVCRNGRGTVVGLLPIVLVRSWITGNRVVSLPFSQYGGPLANDAEAVDCIFTHLKGYMSQGFEYVRVRAREPLDEQFVAQSGWKSSEYYARCVIRLENRSEDDLLKSMGRDARRGIKKSFKDGVVVDICSRMSDLDRVRDLMLQTCKKHGMPAYPPRLLSLIGDLLCSKKLAVVLTARLEEKIIALMILFVLNKEAIYAYNFSDSKYLKFYPNNAMIWTAIKWSLDKGLNRFDLGISSSEDDELLAFKRRWGASEDMLHEYFVTPSDRVIAPDRRASLKYRSAILAWRLLLPTFVASRIGPLLLRHFE